MILKNKWVLIAGIFFIIIILFFITKTRQLVPQKRFYESEISDYLKDGDIICRLGDRLWSQYFKDISPYDKRFSHIGIIKINDDHKITVIHAEGRMAEGKDSVNETDLNEFIEIAKTIGVYRLKDFDGSLISKAALEYIGYPFDWNFNLAEEDKLYCTELLYVIVKKITPDIQLQRVFQKELNREIIPLEAISKSEYFDEILFIN